MANICNNFVTISGKPENIRAAYNFLLDYTPDHGVMYDRLRDLHLRKGYTLTPEDNGAASPVWWEYNVEYTIVDLDNKVDVISVVGGSKGMPPVDFLRLLSEHFHVDVSAKYEDYAGFIGGYFKAVNGDPIVDDFLSLLEYLWRYDDERIAFYDELHSLCKWNDHGFEDVKRLHLSEFKTPLTDDELRIIGKYFEDDAS
jgi:hypothetical protein